MPRLSTYEKELLAKKLARHQIKNSGCKLSEKLCNAKISADCIVRADRSKFSHGAMCPACRKAYNKNYYITKIKKSKDEEDDE
jgi:hypothetical protein